MTPEIRIGDRARCVRSGREHVVEDVAPMSGCIKVEGLYGWVSARRFEKVTEIRVRSMVDDPPVKTGRYCVGHRGQTFGHAFYWNHEDAARALSFIKPGWSQVPDWGPSFWIDAPGGELKFDGPRVWNPKEEKPAPAPVVKSWWRWRWK